MNSVKEKKDLKTYLAEFKGHYLGGQLIVISTTKRRAFNKAKKEIESMLLNTDGFTMDDVIEIDTSKESTIVISNGDY
ncbi:hypothetical protein MOC30_14350 [Bacillus spizizenii]|nr:hypothetical protein [Bacillus spizizenii]